MKKHGVMKLPNGGIRKALAEIGLDDQAACRDVRDLRELLTNWRRIRREATRSLITFGVRAILIFIVLMAAVVISTGFGTGIGR